MFIISNPKSKYPMLQLDLRFVYLFYQLIYKVVIVSLSLRALLLQIDIRAGCCHCISNMWWHCICMCWTAGMIVDAICLNGTSFPLVKHH